MPYGDSEQRNLERPPGSLLIAVWAISIPSRSTNSCGSSQNMTVRIHQRLHLRSPAIHVASFFTGAHDSFGRNLSFYDAGRAESASNSSPPLGIEAARPLAVPTCFRRGWCPGVLPFWRTEHRSPPAVVVQI